MRNLFLLHLIRPLALYTRLSVGCEWIMQQYSGVFRNLPGFRCWSPWGEVTEDRGALRDFDCEKAKETTAVEHRLHGFKGSALSVSSMEYPVFQS